MRNHDSSVFNLGRCVSMSTWACVFFVRSSYFQVASAIHSVMNRSCGFLVNVVTTVVAQCLKLHQKVSFSILRAKRATFILFLSINRWFFFPFYASKFRKRFWSHFKKKFINRRAKNPSYKFKVWCKWDLCSDFQDKYYSRFCVRVACGAEYRRQYCSSRWNLLPVL